MVVGTDLFEWRGQHYLLIVDYLSRFPEIARLESTSSAQVIAHMKSIFSRQGIPVVVRSDNGPQYSSDAFKQFAKTYGFEHRTRSPKHPQSNSEAERMVQTIKKLLNKSEDPYLALLAYRTTPLSNGYSPAEISAGRRLRSTVPTAPQQLIPQSLPWDTIRQKETESREKQKENFDQRRRAKELPPLKEGDAVFIMDRQEHGRVIKQAPFPRSYYIATSSGTSNRGKLVIASEIPEADSDDEDISVGVPDEDPEAELPDQAVPEPVAEADEPAQAVQPVPAAQPVPVAPQAAVTTRSGREVRPPNRYGQN